MVSALHPTAVLTGDKNNTGQMEEEEAHDFIGAVGGWCCFVGGGACGRNNHKVPSTELAAQ